MEISIIGSGYVGTTIAACFADVGHNVVNVDIDEEIVETLNSGNSPIHEPSLDERIEEHAGDRLRATTDYDAILDTDVTFLALSTPSTDDGHIDLSVMEAGAKSLGATLAEKDDYHLVVTKSTVVPTTTEEVIAPILEEHSGKTVGEDFDVGMNPEFLREGSAVDDFLDPDKVVLGSHTDRAAERLRGVFDPLLERAPDASLVETGIREAEMIKYANNAFLAAKISLVNDLANICKEYEVDTDEVLDAIGLDSRIGSEFLGAGVGWGGSCFPKDVAAIVAAARDVGYEPAMLDAAVEVNDNQPVRMLDILRDHADPDGARIAVLGLAFKPGTDDVRNSRAIPLIDALLDAGADVVGYDPVATENFRDKFPDLDYADSAESALDGADAALVVTDWDEFAALDDEFDAMADAVVVDGRNIVTRREGIVYESLV
ncbi:nucleotide sugar dehydrogenase [Halogeometricum borinquense DSM 11551]|uniref:UDP-glucose 6-dehydrogenase n=1 Tax=Halogeometricum borinquense (strain ATCC 700274 / DSM 11551 / JCM 10706 / KCTC 4070 / PR3) TaxID=469382 RepID=E4NLR4_HALBP|nr:UDP-glucose 6-dehydrogenase AglM [Halogeometricum borinquense]ADQ67267.1 nucleotide sugar dehydrogenase [Halogeometricum borinquense DSM 11551]ELY28483.1 nucleotide sugar dehydrogenase [Halogeometricum borinquense DSM 11551]